MRIYFIGQKGIPAIAGGIEKYVESLSTRLAATGHEVFVYTRPHYTDPKMKEYHGVKLISLPSLNFKNLDAISHTFLATINVLFKKADVIHYQGIGPSLMLWLPKLLKPKTKIIVTLHSDDRKHQKWSAFAKFMLGLGAKEAIRYSDAAIAVSQAQKREFEKEFGPCNIKYIPNGVTLYPHFPADVITKRYGLKGQDYILFVSRLVRHKGLQHLIRAYKRLQNPNKKLIIVGGAAHTENYVQEMKELAGDDPNIIFTGELKGLPLFELFSNAYLYVSPSEYEGFSIALLEAMAYGSAVLASDIEPNLEALGGLGFTFKNKVESDLKYQLNNLLTHPEEVETSKKALLDRVRKEFDWDVITRKTLQLYREA